MYLYLRLMGCVVWTIAIVMFIAGIIKIVRAFNEEESGLMICGRVLNLLAIGTVGSAL